MLKEFASELVKCDSCNKVIASDSAYPMGGHHYCSSCIDNRNYNNSIKISLSSEDRHVLNLLKAYGF